MNQDALSDLLGKLPGSTVVVKQDENGKPKRTVLWRGHPMTTHGFRSTFKDRASETTDYASDVVEVALAHIVGNEVERAYRRGDLFEKRAKLMADWARYCVSPQASADVVPLRRAATAAGIRGPACEPERTVASVERGASGSPRIDFAAESALAAARVIKCRS
jgi:hypothetical protein